MKGIIFFQINAFTVGTTKNGAITSSVATCRPTKRCSKSTANNVPSASVMSRTEAIKNEGVQDGGKNEGFSHKN